MVSCYRKVDPKLARVSPRLDATSSTVQKQHDASFVVRIWWEKRGSEQAAPLWRGYIQHVQSGQTAYFSSTHELLALMARWAGDLSPATTVDTPGRAA